MKNEMNANARIKIIKNHVNDLTNEELIIKKIKFITYVCFLLKQCSYLRARLIKITHV